MLKFMTWVFGVLLIAAGVMGFLPATAPEGMLFGFFKVNIWHNLVYIVTGIIAISMANQARLFFRIFGILYAIIAILGFWMGSEPIFGWIANNFADAFLHTGIAVVALYLGFGYKD